MLAEWYYRNSASHAEEPVTAAHLKQLAQLGEIGPETEVRKGADGRWVAASKVKGLVDAIPPKPTTASTDPVPWRQGAKPRESESAQPRAATPAPQSRKPSIDAPPDDQGDRPIPARRTAESGMVESGYPATSRAKQRSSILLVGVGVGGTLLVVGLIAVAFAMFGKKDENQPRSQQVVQNEKKDEPPSTKNNPSAPDTPAISPSLSTPKRPSRGIWPPKPGRSGCRMC